MCKGRKRSKQVGTPLVGRGKEGIKKIQELSSSETKLPIKETKIQGEATSHLNNQSAAFCLKEEQQGEATSHLNTQSAFFCFKEEQAGEANLALSHQHPHAFHTRTQGQEEVAWGFRKSRKLQPAGSLLACFLPQQVLSFAAASTASGLLSL